MRSFRLSRPSVAHWGASALLAVCALGLSAPAEAQWKWRDKNDRVQYSDLPPPGTVPESAILQRPNGAVRSGGPQFAPTPASTPALIPASGPARSVDPELEARRKKAAEEEAAKQKVEQDKLNATRADNCKRAQEQAKMMESGVRVARVNAKGEREFMDDKARADEAKRARGIAATECGNNNAK
jgi:hypothetical protein